MIDYCRSTLRDSAKEGFGRFEGGTKKDGVDVLWPTLVVDDGRDLEVLWNIKSSDGDIPCTAISRVHVQRCS